MQKFNRKKQTLLAFLTLVLILLVAFQLRDSTAYDSTNHDVATGEVADSTLSRYLGFIQDYLSDQRAAFIDTSSVTRDNDSRISRDPFRKFEPRSTKKRTHRARLPLRPAAYKLTGILWEEESPSAMINDRIVRVGSQIGPFKVSRILRNQVILSSQNKTIVLKIK